MRYEQIHKSAGRTACSAATFGSVLVRKVRGPHVGFHRAERTLDRLPPPHGCGLLSRTPPPPSLARASSAIFAGRRAGCPLRPRTSASRAPSGPRTSVCQGDLVSRSDSENRKILKAAISGKPFGSFRRCQRRHRDRYLSTDYCSIAFV